MLLNAVAVITSAKMNLAGTLVVWSLSLLMLSIVSSEQMQRKSMPQTRYLLIN